MKKMFSKIIQTSTVLLISWIMASGMVNRPADCCQADSSFCILSSNRVLISVAAATCLSAAPPYQSSHQPGSWIGYQNSLTDLSVGTSCCETDRCDSDRQTAEFSLIFSQNHYPLTKDVAGISAGKISQPTLKRDNPSIVPRNVPIYILTQSIIC